MKKIGKIILQDLISQGLGAPSGCGSSCGSCPNAGKCHSGVGNMMQTVKLNQTQETAQINVANVCVTNDQKIQETVTETKPIRNDLQEQKLDFKKDSIKSKYVSQNRVQLYNSVVEMALSFVMNQ